MKPLCVYHKNCLDGLGSAAVVRRHAPGCELFAMQHGDPPLRPERILGRRVYMVDFGLPLEQMRALRAQAQDLIWIDHHESQRETWIRLGVGVLDTSECGTSLCWKVLFPEMPLPPVIAYIKDKDLWRWELPDARAIAAGLGQAFHEGNLDALLDADLAAMAAAGRPLLAKQDARVRLAVRNGIAVTDAFGLDGVRTFCVATRRDLNEIAEHILTPIADGGLGYDLAVLCYRKGERGPWVHSLRSERVDCQAIASVRGGGGHPRAASFLAATPLVPPRQAETPDATVNVQV